MKDEGSHLERYARRFNAVEINTSFSRDHRHETYARWSASVPEDFRFAVKIPKTITHEAGLRRCGPALRSFCMNVKGLGEKLAVLLVQLPPSLEFEPRIARDFFARLCGESGTRIVCEPRHATWFGPTVGRTFERWHIGRVAADPVPAEGGGVPAGDIDLVYFRLHGSPRRYYSAYGTADLSSMAARMKAYGAAGRSVWCIFDNTAEFAAWDNAVELQKRVSAGPYIQRIAQ